MTFTATVTAGGNPVTAGPCIHATARRLGSSVALNASGQAHVSTSALAEGTPRDRRDLQRGDRLPDSNGTLFAAGRQHHRGHRQHVLQYGTLTVPGHGPAIPYPSNIFVSGLTGSVTKVTATLNGVSHAVPVDLDVMLSGPAPTTNLLLLSDAGGTAAVSGATIVFDDGAAGPVPTPLRQGRSGPRTMTLRQRMPRFPAPAPASAPRRPWRPSTAPARTACGACGSSTTPLAIPGRSAAAGASPSRPRVPRRPRSRRTSIRPRSAQPVTFTATVTASGAPVTTGTVQFSEGATVLCERCRPGCDRFGDVHDQRPPDRVAHDHGDLLGCPELRGQQWLSGPGRECESHHDHARLQPQSVDGRPAGDVHGDGDGGRRAGHDRYRPVLRGCHRARERVALGATGMATFTTSASRPGRTRSRRPTPARRTTPPAAARWPRSWMRIPPRPPWRRASIRPRSASR